MKNRAHSITLFAFIGCLAGMMLAVAQSPTEPAPLPKLERTVKIGAPSLVHRFSPNGGIEAELVKLINTETQAVHACAYTLTNPKIIAALVAAQQRGVDVQLILDGKYGVQSSQKAIAELKAAHVTLLIDSTENSHGGIAHEKAMIFTAQQCAESGSYNYTGQAEQRNHEAAHFFYHDELTCEQLLIDWTNHAKHSQPAK